MRRSGVSDDRSALAGRGAAAGHSQAARIHELAQVAVAQVGGPVVAAGRRGRDHPWVGRRGRRGGDGPVCLSGTAANQSGKGEEGVEAPGLIQQLRRRRP